MLTPPPSPVLDAAFYDLLNRISNFSDDHFNAEWLHLSELETEVLLVKLLQHWTEHLEGRLLVGLLLEVREART